MPRIINFYKLRDEHGYCSNFSAHGVDLDGHFWRTTEHYYQGMKTLQADEREEIRLAATPRKARNLGQECLMRADWESVAPMPEQLQAMFSDDHGMLVASVKDHFMFSALVAKFHQHQDIRTTLVGTGDAILVENSPVDSYWGNGPKGNGQNKLGRMLMLVRKRIQEGVMD